MQDILALIDTYINEFNSNKNASFSIDSIRIDFNKQHKVTKLKELGTWVKIDKHSNILHKLKKRLINEELTSAYRLDGYDIYYYNLQDPPKYRRARMVIFGLTQYHKATTPKSTVRNVLQVLKDVTNIDICFDTDTPPNLEALARHFTLSHYKSSTYINAPCITMVERIIFYNKQVKNNLSEQMWRMEALVSIPNIKVLALPLHDLEAVIKLAWEQQ